MATINANVESLVDADMIGIAPLDVNAGQRKVRKIDYLFQSISKTG